MWKTLVKGIKHAEKENDRSLYILIIRPFRCRIRQCACGIVEGTPGQLFFCYLFIERFHLGIVDHLVCFRIHINLYKLSVNLNVQGFLSAPYDQIPDFFLKNGFQQFLCKIRIISKYRRKHEIIADRIKFIVCHILFSSCISYCQVNGISPFFLILITVSLICLFFRQFRKKENGGNRITKRNSAIFGIMHFVIWKVFLNDSSCQIAFHVVKNGENPHLKGLK